METNKVSLEWINIPEQIKSKQEQLRLRILEIKRLQGEAVVLESQIKILKKYLAAETQLELTNPESCYEIYDETKSDITLLGITEAIEKVLKKQNRCMTIRDIYETLSKENYLINGKNPKNTLRGVLGTSKKFYFKDGCWGLPKWKVNNKESE